jgi:hypothetical protein
MYKTVQFFYQLFINQFLIKAPIGCLQYYSGLVGTVKTMNFDCAKYVVNQEISDECLMANLEYNICIRLEAQMCAIKWTANHFDMGPDGVITSQRGDCNLEIESI